MILSEARQEKLVFSCGSWLLSAEKNSQ